MIDSMQRPFTVQHSRQGSYFLVSKRRKGGIVSPGDRHILASKTSHKVCSAESDSSRVILKPGPL